MKPAEPTPVAPGPGRCHSTSRIPPTGSASAAALMAAAVPSPKVATWRARQAGATPVTPKLLRSARTTPSIAVPWLRKLSASIGVPAITPAASPCRSSCSSRQAPPTTITSIAGAVAAGDRPRRACVDAAGRRVQVALARREVGVAAVSSHLGRGLHGGPSMTGAGLTYAPATASSCGEPRGHLVVIRAARELDAVVDREVGRPRWRRRVLGEHARLAGAEERLGLDGGLVQRGVQRPDVAGRRVRAARVQPELRVGMGDQDELRLEAGRAVVRRCRHLAHLHLRCADRCQPDRALIDLSRHGSRA